MVVGTQNCRSSFTSGHEPTVVTGSFMATRVDDAPPEATTNSSPELGPTEEGIVQL